MPPRSAPALRPLRRRGTALATPALVLVLAASPLAGCGGGGSDGAEGDAEGPPTTVEGTDADLAEILEGVVADPATEPGCAVAVSRDGTVVATAASGLADLEHGIPITVDSVFDIGSVSKQFTAAAAVLLAEDGTIALGDDIHTIIPALPDYGAPVTIDMALHHASGIPDYAPLLAEGYKDADVTTADDAYLLLQAAATPTFPPGSSWTYSNSNYFLVGLAIEETTGEELEDVLRDRLFGPLDMTSTRLRDHFDEVVPDVAPAYRPTTGDDGGGAPPDGAWAVNMTDWEQVGDGAILSTVGDLLRWQGALEGNDAAPFDLYEALQFGPVDMGDGKTTYARGLISSEHDGVATVGHSGTSAGYRSALEASPSDGLATAVLCNRADADAESIAFAALASQRD